MTPERIAELRADTNIWREPWRGKLLEALDALEAAQGALAASEAGAAALRAALGEMRAVTRTLYLGGTSGNDVMTSFPGALGSAEAAADMTLATDSGAAVLRVLRAAVEWDEARGKLSVARSADDGMTDALRAAWHISDAKEVAFDAAVAALPPALRGAK